MPHRGVHDTSVHTVLYVFMLTLLERVSGWLWDYQQQRATMYAKLAGAAYCSTPSLEQWSCGPKCQGLNVRSVRVCHGQSTRAYTGLWEHRCLLSFQGTSNTDAWLTNLDAKQRPSPWKECHPCKVHEGFLHEYNSLKFCIIGHLLLNGCGPGSWLRTTGHSLGAALNGLAMIDLTNYGWHIEESYHFGQPRIGDHNFAATFNRLFRGRAWRITHGMDPAPQVPPEFWQYEHVEPEIYYKGLVSQGYKVCRRVHARVCIEQYKGMPLSDLLHAGDHLNYMGVNTYGKDCVNITNNTMDFSNATAHDQVNFFNSTKTGSVLVL